MMDDGQGLELGEKGGRFSSLWRRLQYNAITVAVTGRA